MLLTFYEINGIIGIVENKGADFVQEINIMLRSLSPFVVYWTFFIGAVSFVLGMYFMLGIDALVIKFNNWKQARKELKNKEKEV